MVGILTRKVKNKFSHVNHKQNIVVIKHKQYILYHCGIARLFNNSGGFTPEMIEGQ